ncbi:MAG: nuclear transport factor 2 family protein [Rhodospirillales bacterium]|nr:nuclear transport factor 2 family protein [Rhodospirillales bacterium]
MNDSDLLDELRARMEITDVLHLYCRAIDRVELDLLADVYHPGAIDEHGVYNGDAEGFVESLKAALAGPTSRFRMMQHSISNIMIERTGDSAKVQSHFRAYHRREDKSGKWDEALGGRYLDKFERRDGAWKIAHRVCVYDWSRIEPATEQRWWELFGMDDQFHLGQRDRTDPLYGFLEG